MRELSIFNRQRSKTYLFYVICIFLIMLISGCGDGSDDNLSSIFPENGSNVSSETGSASFSVAWHDAPVIEAYENPLTTAQMEPLDCQGAGVVEITCEVYEGSSTYLTSGGPWPCSSHNATINNIPAGTGRTFVVLGEDGEGNILYHGKVSDTTIRTGETTNVGTIDTYPFVPTELTVSGWTSSSISFSWNAPAGNNFVAGYRIYRGGVFLKAVTTTSAIDMGLSPSTQYCYTISAYDEPGNESYPSNEVCQSTDPDDIPPTTPTGLSVEAISLSQINLTWNASNDNVGVAGYRIYRGGVFLKAVTTNSTSDTGLNPSTQYCYTISAYDAIGNVSGLSNQDCATTGTPPITPPTPNPMTWFTEPYATSTSSISMVATTASDPSTPITYTFDFVDSPTGGSGGGPDSEWQTSTTYSDLGLGTNQRYGYRVRARDGEGNVTDYSSPTSYAYTLANRPGYPPGGPFFNVTQNSIRVTWTADGNPFWTEYYCENITNGTNSGWTTNLYWDSTGLSCGNSYVFRVKARNGDRIETSWRNLDNEYTQACPPPTPPVISNISYQIQNANADYCINASGETFSGTDFNINFSYNDINGDVSKSAGAKVWAGFNNPTPSFDATNFSTFIGDGFTGSINSDLCYRFGSSTSINVYMKLDDGAGGSSNTLNINIPRPAGAP